MDVLRLRMLEEVVGLICDCNRLKYFSVSIDAELNIVACSVGLLLSNSTEYSRVNLSDVFKDKYLGLIISVVEKYKRLGLVPLSHHGSMIFSWLVSSDYNNMSVLKSSNIKKQIFLDTIGPKLTPGNKFSVSQLFDSLLDISKKRPSLSSHAKKEIWSEKRIGQRRGDRRFEYIVNDKSFFESWSVLASIVSIKNNLGPSLVFARKYNLPYLTKFLTSLQNVNLHFMEPSINKVVSEEVNYCLPLLSCICEALDDLFICLYKRRLGEQVKGVFVIHTDSCSGRELRVDGHSLFVPYDNYSDHEFGLSYEETFVSIFKVCKFSDLVDLLVIHFKDVECEYVA
jgi:hypothetical protein